MKGGFITVAELLAIDWRDADAWPVDHLTRLNWALAEAQAGRRTMTGVPCGGDGEPAGERRTIPLIELAALRFPLASPGKYDLFAPPGTRAYTDVEIAREPPAEFPAAVHAETITHSGFPGRPSKAKHLIEDEFKRRTKSGETLRNLADEAAALLDWLIEAHPNVARPTKGTIENNIRGDHRRWKATIGDADPA